MDKYAKLGSVKVDHWNVIPSVKSFKVNPKMLLLCTAVMLERVSQYSIQCIHLQGAFLSTSAFKLQS